MTEQGTRSSHEDGCICLDCILDGLALWDEHKPQSAEDWYMVALRCAADADFDVEKASPIFGAAVLLARGVLNA